MSQPANLSFKRWAKFVVAGVVVLLAAAGIGVRLYLADASKQKLTDAYPRLEALLAIYSVLSWRSPEQLPPLVTETSETSGSELTLDCPAVEWGTGGVDRTDSLFSCFEEPRTVYVPEAGEEVETIQLISSEEYSYEFAWDSVFGYELPVFIRGYEALEADSPIGQDRDNCMRELADDNSRYSTCYFNMYSVTISGLTVSSSVSFITADGRLSWNPNGTVQRREERVVYFDQATPITVGAINTVLQKTLRSLGIVEQDMSRIGPQVEALWMSKDDAFLQALVAEIDQVPDLINLSGYLQGN